MPVKFIGYIGFNNESEIHGLRQIRALDRDYVEAAAKAQEEGGFDRVLVPFGSNSPESQIVAAHAAAITTKLGFLIAHRPGFTQPTVAARQLATLDQLSGGRIAVHIITGGADEEMAKDGDVSTKAERYARTDEYLKVLRQEWTAEKPFDHDGDFYRIRSGFAAVKPQNLPVFFGGSSPEAIEVAGRHADVYALWGETQEQVREAVSTISAAARRNGRKAPGFSLSLRPIIADTEEAAWKRADEIVEIVREIREKARACRRRRRAGQFDRAGRHTRASRRCADRLLCAGHRPLPDPWFRSAGRCDPIWARAVAACAPARRALRCRARE